MRCRPFIAFLRHVRHWYQYVVKRSTKYCCLLKSMHTVKESYYLFWLNSLKRLNILGETPCFYWVLLNLSKNYLTYCNIKQCLTSSLPEPKEVPLQSNMKSLKAEEQSFHTIHFLINFLSTDIKIGILKMYTMEFTSELPRCRIMTISMKMSVDHAF